MHKHSLRHKEQKITEVRRNQCHSKITQKVSTSNNRSVINYYKHNKEKHSNMTGTWEK